jgi:hypothetical protein
MYATVESTALGLATVRLANRGARLTNLPILGAAVAPGERVIVDYSAEGKPIVRPYTIRVPDVVPENISPMPIEENNSDFVYLELTRSTPVEYEYYSSSSPISFYANHFLPFETAIHDTAGIFVPSVGGFRCSSGVYWVSITIAVQPKWGINNDANNFRANPHFGSFRYPLGIQWRRWITQDTTLVLSYGGIYKLDIDIPHPVTSAAALSSYGSVRLVTDGGPQLSTYPPSIGDPNPPKFLVPVLANRYPILRLLKIADTDQNISVATPWWSGFS